MKLRVVIYDIYKGCGEGGAYIKTGEAEGYFHEWATRTLDALISCRYACAIIEKPDGTIIEVTADRVRFKYPPETSDPFLQHGIRTADEA